MDGGGPETCGVALEADHLECGSSAHAAQMIQMSLPSGGATRRSRVSGAIRIRHSRPAATWCGALHHLPRKDRHTLAHTPILRPLSVRSFVPSSSLNFCGPYFLFLFFAKLCPLDLRGEDDLPRLSRVEHSDHEMWWRGSTSHAVVVAMLISMGQAPAALFVKQARGAEAMHSPTPASAVKRLRAGLPLPGKIYAEQGNGQPPTWSIGSVADASGRPRCSHCPLFVLPLSAVAASTVSSAATRILYPGRSPLLRAMERGKLCVATQRLGTWPLLHAHSRFRMAASRDGGGAREETSAEAIMKAGKACTDVRISFGIPVPVEVWDQLLVVWKGGGGKTNKHNRRNQRMGPRSPLMSICFPVTLSRRGDSATSLVDQAAKSLKENISTLPPFRVTLGRVDCVPGMDGGWCVVVELSESKELEKVREQLVMLAGRAGLVSGTTTLFAAPSESGDEKMEDGFVARLQLATFKTRGEAYAARERIVSSPTSDGAEGSRLITGVGNQVSWEVKMVVMSQLAASSERDGQYYIACNSWPDYYRVVALGNANSGPPDAVDRQSQIESRIQRECEEEFGRLFATLVPPSSGPQAGQGLDSAGEGKSKRGKWTKASASVQREDALRVLTKVMGDFEIDLENNKQLLECGRWLLKLESGINGLDADINARIKLLRKRSTLAKRVQNNLQLRSEADAECAREDDALPEDEQENAVGGEWQVLVKEKAASTFMSMFELEEEELEDEEVEEEEDVVREGDDEGLMPLGQTWSTASIDTGDEQRDVVDGSFGGGSPLVELTRRVLDDLSSAGVLGDLQGANVSEPGSLGLSVLQRNLEGVDTRLPLTGDLLARGAASEAVRQGQVESRGRGGVRGQDRTGRALGGIRGRGREGVTGRGTSRFASRVGANNVPRSSPARSGAVVGIAGDRGVSRGAQPLRRGARVAGARRENKLDAKDNLGVQILLVRHGQSTWNAQGRWQGQADMPLSSLGLAQSALAAVRLASNESMFCEEMGIINITAVYTSNMQRAVQTASILSQQAGLGPIVQDARLRERSVGEWSGLTYDEVQRKWPGYLKRRLLPPSYETDDHVLPRVFAALEDVRQAHPGGRVVVVCHAGVIYAVEAYLKAKARHRNAQRRYRIANLGSRWIFWDGQGFRLGKRVDLVPNDK